MDRRTMLGALGTGTAASLLLSSGATNSFASQDHDHHNQAMEECLKACGECAKTCDEMFHHCFKMVEAGKKDHAGSAKSSLDCAAFCGMAACMIARHSTMSDLACSACADACKRCGDECSKIDSPEMKKCVEACRKCETACRAMVNGRKEGAAR